MVGGEEVKTNMPLYDKNGIPIKPFDVLKMFHFVGARRKKHYMYKWVFERDGYLYAHHLDRSGEQGAFFLSQDLLENTEIVQGYGPHGSDDYSDRSRRKPQKE